MTCAMEAVLGAQIMWCRIWRKRGMYETQQKNGVYAYIKRQRIPPLRFFWMETKMKIIKIEKGYGFCMDNNKTMGGDINGL